jgi:hypothetical protein
MLKLTIEDKVIGPHKSIERVEDAYIIDSAIFPIAVIGEGIISTWVGDYPEIEIDPIRYEAVRKKRDALIKESDWRVIRATETGVAMSQDWTDYRQALRDISNQDRFPVSINWPTEPE